MAGLHDKGHFLQSSQVVQRVALDGDDVRERPALEHPDLAAQADGFRGFDGRGANRLERLQSKRGELDEFFCVLAVADDAGVSAESDGESIADRARQMLL